MTVLPLPSQFILRKWSADVSFMPQFRITYCIENKNLLEQKNIQSTRCRTDMMGPHRKIAEIAFYIRICFFCFTLSLYNDDIVVSKMCDTVVCQVYRIGTRVKSLCAFRSWYLIRFLALHFFHFNALGVFRIQLHAKLQCRYFASSDKGGEMNAKRFSGDKKRPHSPLLIVNTMKCEILFFHVNSFSLYFAFASAERSRRISSAFISVQLFFLFHQPLPYNDALLRRGNSSLPSTNATEQDRAPLMLQTSIISTKSNSKMKNRVSAGWRDVFPRVVDTKCVRKIMSRR